MDFILIHISTGINIASERKVLWLIDPQEKNDLLSLSIITIILYGFNSLLSCDRYYFYYFNKTEVDYIHIFFAFPLTANSFP